VHATAHPPRCCTTSPWRRDTRPRSARQAVEQRSLKQEALRSETRKRSRWSEHHRWGEKPLCSCGRGMLVRRGKQQCFLSTWRVRPAKFHAAGHSKHGCRCFSRLGSSGHSQERGMENRALGACVPEYCLVPREKMEGQASPLRQFHFKRVEIRAVWRGIGSVMRLLRNFLAVPTASSSSSSSKVLGLQGRGASGTGWGRVVGGCGRPGDGASVALTVYSLVSRAQGWGYQSGYCSIRARATLVDTSTTTNGVRE